MKRKRVAIYARVSTDGQTLANQQRELEEIAQRHHWDVIEVFTDKGISGAKGRDKRPGFNALMKGVTRRDFDLVAAWSVDRLGRSMMDLVGFLMELHAKGVDLYLHKQGLDTSTPAGQLMFNVLGAFATFEREIIRERVKAGMARAKAENKPIGRPRVSEKIEATVRRELAAGKGIRRVATDLGIGTGTVQRIKAEVDKE